jgi:hypothetical protein
LPTPRQLFVASRSIRTRPVIKRLRWKPRRSTVVREPALPAQWNETLAETSRHLVAPHGSLSPFRRQRPTRSMVWIGFTAALGLLAAAQRVTASALTTTITANERTCFYAAVDKVGEKVRHAVS